MVTMGIGVLLLGGHWIYSYGPHPPLLSLIILAQKKKEKEKNNTVSEQMEIRIDKEICRIQGY